MTRRYAMDITILEKTKTGTAVYARSLIDELRRQLPGAAELILLRGPRSVPRKNFLTTLVNGVIELCWLNVMLPVIVLFRRIDVIHFPANIIPFRAMRI